MPIVSRSALVDYTADEMYRLVSDVEAYPEFLPWCSSASAEPENEHTVVATIEIRKGPLRQSFTTRNHATPGRCIRMELVRGPFEHLEGAWSFEGIGGQGARVSLELSFSFANAVLRATFGKVFDHVAGEMVGAFCRRADLIYGPR